MVDLEVIQLSLCTKSNSTYCPNRLYPTLASFQIFWLSTPHRVSKQLLHILDRRDSARRKKRKRRKKKEKETAKGSEDLPLDGGQS
jgi:hypothetical protein